MSDNWVTGERAPAFGFTKGFRNTLSMGVWDGGLENFQQFYFTTPVQPKAKGLTSGGWGGRQLVSDKQ